MDEARLIQSRTASRGRRVARRFDVRAALVLWLMFSAAAQGVIAQAHVHFRYEHAPSTAGVVVAATPDDRSSPDQDSRDPSTCALCQVLAYGAAPLAHTFDVALALAGPGFAPSRGGEEPLLVSAVSHSWTSRGPPLL